jgi:hypothetical protein
MNQEQLKVHFRKYIDPTTGLLDPRLIGTLDYYQKVQMLGSVIQEVERKNVVKMVSKNLSTGPQKVKTDYVFLTINFDPSKSFEECFRGAQKLGNRQIWDWSLWVHEQRATTEVDAGHGHHVHLLAKVSKAAPNARTKVKTAMSKLCDTRQHSIFNWKWIPEEYILDKLSYITDDKALEKQDKQRIDRVWRILNKISPLYHNGKTSEEVQATYQEAPVQKGPQSTIQSSRKE